MSTNSFKTVLSKTPGVNLVYKFLASIKYDGFRATTKRVLKKLFRGINWDDGYRVINLTDEEIEKQKNTTFNKNIKFSIVVPLYNTKIEWLKDMINSVLWQTYGNVELCLADGSDSEHSYVGEYCMQLKESDSRVVYQKLEKNGGISENTNACLNMATGDYVGLLDHDDMLHRSALFEVMQAICGEGADFIYTDEEVVSEDLKKHICAHFKPDFAIDNLRANNYICHFTVFKRSLLEKSGGFRKECDGSQDHDIILRLTRVAEKIVHIPKILYHWRACEGSVAMESSAKPYTTIAGIRAVTDSLREIGLEAEVDRSRICPTIYTIKYKLKANPLVSIIIKNTGDFKALKGCIDSILQVSTYSNYELVVVDCGAAGKQAEENYSELCLNEKIKVVGCKTGQSGGFSSYNTGAKNAKGEHLVFLNENAQVLTPDWLEELLMYSQREDVGIVGAKIICGKRIKNAGLILGLKGLVGQSHKNLGRSQAGYMGRLGYSQNVSAVTLDCMMVRSSIFEAIGGFEDFYELELADADLCLKARKKGFLVVWTPHSEVSVQGEPLKNRREKKAREKDRRNFRQRWEQEIKAGDPYYNCNLTLKSEDFSYEK